jgi:hypothetical protein
MSSRSPFKPSANPATASLRSVWEEAIRNTIRARVGHGPEGMVLPAWSWTHGLGLFAATNIPRGRIVLTGRVLQSGSDWDPGWTVTIRPGMYAWLSPAAAIVNHSCAPNLGIVDLGRDGYAFRALRDISAGDELTREYGCTEGWDTGIVYCHCGAACCTGAVPGYLVSTPERKARLRELGVAQWIRELEAPKIKKGRHCAA